MEVATGSGSAGPPPPRKEWRVVSELSVQNAGSQELERSKLGQSDERTIHEHGQEALDVVDFCSIQIGGIMGVDDGFLQQRIQSVDRQREELQQMEIELRAQMIAKSETMGIQNKLEVRLKEQANVSARLQEQLCERQQTIHELERKMEEKERELHAVRLDNEAAWAKDDLLREQNKELATFRRERDSIEAERAHHIKQINDLQEHLQDKERQLLELQEQNRVAKETIVYKDEQIRDAQSWMARVQEIDVLQSSTLQAELRERTEQYNQLWLGCQRQFAEMERLHVQAMQRLQLELAGARRKSGTYNAESTLSQNSSSDGSYVGSNGGHHLEANGGIMTNVISGSLPNGISDNSQTVISSGNASAQTNHVATLPVTAPSILGMPSYFPPGQLSALHPYVMHQQGANHSVPTHVAQSHVNHVHSVPAMASFQQWQNQQAVSEGLPISSQHQYAMSQTEEIPMRAESNYSYESSANGTDLHPDYLHAHMNQRVNPNLQMSPAEEAKTVESIEKSYLVGPETQHSLQQISSQFSEALRLEPHNQTSEIKALENNATNIADNRPQNQELATEELESAANVSASEASGHPVHFADATMNSAVDAGLSEGFVSATPANSLLTGKRTETVLLDERALLACIVRTIPAGGKIHISSTLPNRLGKMLAPLHWHDYKRTYGKLDDFVASHPELFVIEGDYIQLREGAQGIVAATAAVAKVAAAAATASSPYLSFFPSVAITPIAQVGRVRTSADSNHSSAIQSLHSNGSGFNTSGGLLNVKVLSKSKDPFELNGSDSRPGQSLFAPAQNGLHSDRSVLLNAQSKGPIHVLAGANFVGKQQSRNVLRG